MYYGTYDALAIHFQESHFRCMEPECLEKLFIVFESEGALDYHMERTHRHSVKTKAGKSQFDATKLLGVKLDAPEEDELDEDEQAAIEGMDLELMEETAKEMKRQGVPVPELVLQIIKKAKSKKNNESNKVRKIELRDNQGKDMTRIVIGFKISFKRPTVIKSTFFLWISTPQKRLWMCATS